MRIEYAKEGGLAYIPKLSAPVVIDTDALAPDQAQALETMLQQAAFFELPEKLGKARAGAADYQTYTITVRDGDRSHTVRVSDLDERPEIAQLVRALEKQAKEIRRGKPGT